MNEKLLLLSGKAERADVGNDFERIGVDVSGPVDDRIDGVYGNLLILGVLRGSCRTATKNTLHKSDENGLKGSNGIS